MIGLLIYLIIILIIFGVILYAINALPIQQPFKNIAYILVILVLLLILLSLIGVVPLGTPHVLMQ